MFRRWIHEVVPEPYGSYGNGAAMRVSAAAYLNRHRALGDALGAADRVTTVTHDHSEGIKGARATTHAIWLAFQGTNPDDIRHAIAEAYAYDLSRGVDQIRPGYTFDETCQGTVPEAITCALESANFEDAVRNAISLGGDSDTLGAIAGPIREALHGTPTDLIATAKQRHLGQASDIIEAMEGLYGKISRSGHQV